MEIKTKAKKCKYYPIKDKQQLLVINIDRKKFFFERITKKEFEDLGKKLLSDGDKLSTDTIGRYKVAHLDCKNESGYFFTLEKGGRKNETLIRNQNKKTA